VFSGKKERFPMRMTGSQCIDTGKLKCGNKVEKNTKRGERGRQPYVLCGAAVYSRGADI